MKKRDRRKTFTRRIVSLLAAVVLLTSSQWFRSLAIDLRPDTQTGYESLIAFQVDRWNTILEAVFGETMPKASVSGNTASVTIPANGDIAAGSKAVVQPGNAYFNWDTAHTSGLPAWSGGSGEITLEQIPKRIEKIQYAADSVQDDDKTYASVDATTVEYTVYDVSNADQLYCVMNAVKNVEYNVKINLCADIDLNGANKVWYSEKVDPVCNRKDYWYYIEGNGYTIYNMKTCATAAKTASFLGYLENPSNSSSSKKVVLKNLNFSNCLVISSQAQSAVVVSMNEGRLYMENVNVTDSFLHSGGANVAGILGRNECRTGAMFMHNCSTSGLYAFGTNHVGGFSGTFYNNNMENGFPVPYNTAFPASPESWMGKKEITMPLMVENCYSVDSELFSVGKDGDSGAFISCGAKFICRNSFTNNTIYGSTNTGAFIGRIVTEAANARGMLDDTEAKTVCTYFEDCYASGSVEGRDKIGGFVGYDCGAQTTDGYANYGVTVYKNCYTTAMAGMDYAGKQVGGFIGHENTRKDQKARIAVGTDEGGNTVYTENPGAVYINCYAAGEVGNILTETDADYKCNPDESDAQGGFLGAVGFWGFMYINESATDRYGKAQEGESNGNYINCYYDKQTTGMRERASGKWYSFAKDEKNPTKEEYSQIPGVTGVYTQYSEAKKVMGLAHSDANEAMSVNMGDSNVWMYRNEYYPALVSFFGTNAVNNFGTLKQSGTIVERTEITNGSDEDGIAAAEEEPTEPVDDQKINDIKDDTNTDNTERTDGITNTDGAEITEGTGGTEDTDRTENTADTADPVSGGADAQNADGTQTVKDADGADGTQTVKDADGADGTQNAGGTDDVQNAGDKSDADGTQNAGDISGADGTGDANGPEGTGTAGGTENTDDILQNPVQSSDVTLFSVDGTETLNAGEAIPMYDEDTRARIQRKLDEKAALVPNYLQASVSTVFLDHWDSAMNMDTGGLSGETDWVLGLEANKLTQKEYQGADSKWEQDDDDKYWEITYKNLASGAYALKVQAGDSWTYNFGSDKFSGSACELKVPEDCDVKVKFDYVAPASITTENTTYRIWAEFYHDLYDENGAEKEDAKPFATQILGYNTMEDLKNTWTVVGSLPGSNWDRTNTDFDMEYVGTGLGNGDYKLVKTLAKGDYSFQITKDHLWDECYGLSGNNGREKNMTFTLKEECEVTILFNENTHLTTVTTNPSNALATCKTGEAEVEFDGYSVISSKAITGYNWLESYDAAKAGEMTGPDEDGVYTAAFTVKGKENFNKTHGYKVITDGKDEGVKTYFYLDGPGENADEDEYTRTLRFCYNPTTGANWVEDADADGNNNWINNEPEVDTWNVLGCEALTGKSWDEDMSTDEKEAKSRGLMELADGSTGSTDSYFKNYENLPAGTYSFKVAANGSFDSGIEYGDRNGNNYQFTINQAATVIIVFHSDSKEITVATNPDIALDDTEYVVSGTKSLTGSSWDASDTDKNIMGYMGGYYATYRKEYPVVGGGNYAFKVVHAGKDDKTDPIRIQVGGDAGKAYTLQIDYHERNALTEYHLYDGDTDVTDLLSDLEYDSWSVLGEKGLTGYNWEDAENNNQEKAAEAGKMTESNGLWTKTFTDIAVSRTPQILNFKVAAEGTWDTGVAYGDSEGNNYTIVLQSDTVTKCNVTITFDPATHAISVSASPDCLMTGEIDESNLVWYIAGDYTLVSEDAYYTAPTVYDTVRDITASFTFTNGTNVAWELDEARNKASRFFSKIQSTKDGEPTEGFDLSYKVENKEIEGTFNEKVITLDGNGTDGYRCDRFMPGKQWVKVSAHSDMSGAYGSRSIRLIPTAYLEAGNDADIYVLQSASDTELKHVGNKVVYKENDLQDEVTFTGLDGVTFDRYNVALTAAYAITDRIGFGYYGNYSKQNVVDYSEAGIRPNELAPYEKDQYFAMSSVFTKSASYDGQEIAEGETSNLVIDELVDQNLIGSSYGDDKAADDQKETKAKTIIKVARLYADGGTTKVFMTRNKSDGDEADRAKTAYEKNYLKWTGQMPFDSDDEGTYQVTYYWSLSDGRYLSDTKKVAVYSGRASISKKVDTECFEIEETKNEKTTTLTYTVTYNNPVKGDFAIVDVLPFDGDIRKDGSQITGFNSSQIGKDTTLKLTSVTVGISGVKGAAITGTSYTTNTGVREYLNEGTNSAGDAAEQILDNSVKFSWISVGGTGELINGVDNAAAIMVKGNQPADGDSLITLTYQIEVSNAQRGDYYVNNAFFTVTETEKESPMTVNGVSNPVLTAAVGREFSGYVWLDSDLDGRFDDTEPAIEGVTVTLQKLTDDTWADVKGKTIYSNAEGYYAFTDVYPAGTYRVVFRALTNEKGTVTLHMADGTESREVEFEKLNLTRRLAHYQVSQKNLSRNIADHLKQDKTEKDYYTYYINEELPTAELIFQHNTQLHFLEGYVKDYYFTREFQNLGLTEVKDVEEKVNSLTIEKREGDLKGKLLGGVKFKLEYSLKGADYQPVSYYEKENTETGRMEYVFVNTNDEEELKNLPEGTKILPADAVETATNGDFIGTFRFVNLPTADYRLTEVEALDGYNPLTAPVEFSLPYGVKEGETGGYITGNGENSDKSEVIDGFRYYYDVTYTITNSKPFHMPLTGRLKQLFPLILAIILFTGAVGLYTGYRIKKRKNGVR